MMASMRSWHNRRIWTQPIKPLVPHDTGAVSVIPSNGRALTTEKCLLFLYLVLCLEDLVLETKLDDRPSKGNWY